MEKLLPGQQGSLILNEDGAVLNSSGDLENDEQIAEVLYQLISTISKKTLLPSGSQVNFHRMSIHYNTHVYSVVLSNRKFHIVKRKYLPNEPIVT